MNSISEINWDNFKESINRLGVLCSFLIVFGTTISIYLRETLGIVIGVPDDIEVFGVPLNRQEAFLAILVIYLVQWAVLKNLIFLRQMFDKQGCEIEKCRAFALGRQNVFNPFARFDGGLGSIFSLIGLSAFVIGTFLFPIIFAAKAITSGLATSSLLVVFYLPLFALFIYNLFALDVELVSKKYAFCRMIFICCSIVFLVYLIWLSTA